MISFCAVFDIYYALLHSRLNYCCTSWAAWEPRGNKVILKRLQAACNKFFRLTFYLDRTDSVRSILKSNDILNISQTYDYNVCIEMYKAIHKQSPTPIQKMLTTENKFFFNKNSRIKQTQKCITYAGPNLWKGLPLQLKQVGCLETYTV